MRMSTLLILSYPVYASPFATSSLQNFPKASAASFPDVLYNCRVGCLRCHLTRASFVIHGPRNDHLASNFKKKKKQWPSKSKRRLSREEEAQLRLDFQTWPSIQLACSPVFSCGDDDQTKRIHRNCTTKPRRWGGGGLGGSSLACHFTPSFWQPEGHLESQLTSRTRDLNWGKVHTYGGR